MFVQVIQGRVRDRDAVRRAGERWSEELRGGADGFLGGTVGVSDDGWLVNIARFESEDAARRNSDRPEQGAWWDDFSACFEGEPVFAEGTDAEVIAGGGSDEAGFVQAVIARGAERDALTALEQQVADRLGDLRPDYIGGIRLWHGESEFVELAYFTTEEAARRGEQQELPAEVAENLAAWQEKLGEVTYRDLRHLTFL